MIIEEDDFKMELNEGKIKFDLSIKSVINAKNPEKRKEEFKKVAHGMTREWCMEHIINHRISRKYDSISMKNYLQEFKKERESLKKLFHE